MKDMLDDIPDDELRRRLRNFEEEPDSDLWNKMEDAIPPPVRPMPEQLKNYTEAPDETVWRGIESGLRFEVAAFRMEVAAGVLSVLSLLMLVVPLMLNSPGESVNRYSLNEDSVNLSDSISDDRGEGKRIEDITGATQHSKVADTGSEKLNEDQTKSIATHDNDHQKKDVVGSDSEKIDPALESQQLLKGEDVSASENEGKVSGQRKMNSKKVVQPSSGRQQKDISKSGVSTLNEKKNNKTSDDDRLSSDRNDGETSSDNEEQVTFERKKGNSGRKNIAGREGSALVRENRNLTGDGERRSSERKGEIGSGRELQSFVGSKNENISNTDQQGLVKDEGKIVLKTDTNVPSVKQNEGFSKETPLLPTVLSNENTSGKEYQSIFDLRGDNASGKDDQLRKRENEIIVATVIAEDSQRVGNGNTSLYRDKDQRSGVDSLPDVAKRNVDNEGVSVKVGGDLKDVSRESSAGKDDRRLISNDGSDRENSHINQNVVNAVGDISKKPNGNNKPSVNPGNDPEDANEKLPVNRENEGVISGDKNVMTSSGLNAVAADTTPRNKQVRMTYDLSTGQTSIADSTAKMDSAASQLVSKQRQMATAPLRDTQKRESPKQRELGIYALVMPTLGYQEVRPLTQDNIFITSVDRISAFSSKRLGIRGEIGVERTLRRGWSVNAGLLYYQRKQSITYRYNDGSSVDVIELPGDSMSYAVQPRSLSGTFEYEVKNIGVLAGFNYSIKGKQFEQRVGMSGELHKPLSRDGEAGGRSIYLFANAYYRLSYRLSRRLDLMLQPTFNYSLQVDNRTNAPFYVKPYGLGLNCGVFYHF